MRPSYLPKPTFGVVEQTEAYKELGANCGPGAIAGTCGVTPREVLSHMPDFNELGHAREWMIEGALDALGVSWTPEDPDTMSFGIARILWGGAWNASDNRFDRLAHSHWIGLASTRLEGSWVFDINAIGVGGWITQQEWSGNLVPWLLRKEEPQWDGTWSFGEGYAFPPKEEKALSRNEGSALADRLRAHDILLSEHPYLHSHPEICGGRVVIRHTRLSTTAVAQRVAHGDSLADILEDYPDLSDRMVGAALGHGRRQIAANTE